MHQAAHFWMVGEDARGDSGAPRSGSTPESAVRSFIESPVTPCSAHAPRKPLRLLAGLPLIVRVWQRVSAMKIADACVVATDDDSVAEAARDAGAECVMTSESHTSGTERVAEVARMSRFATYSTIVNVQGDEPFIGARAVEGAAQMVASERFPLGTAAAEAAGCAGIMPITTH